MNVFEKMKIAHHFERHCNPCIFNIHEAVEYRNARNTEEYFNNWIAEKHPTAIGKISFNNLEKLQQDYWTLYYEGIAI